MTALPADSPSDPAGSVKLVEFTLQAGPSWRSMPDRSTRSITPSPSSSPVPTMLAGMMKDPDRVRAKRVAEAMLGMVELDIAGLQKAYDAR